MKLIHISDLHLNLNAQNNNIERLTRFFAYLKLLSPDHLVITGDLSENGEPEELETLKEIMEFAGFLDSAKATVIIGNHDIFGGVHRAEDILTFPDRCAKTDYEGKISAFHEIFAELFSGCRYPLEGQNYPFIKIVDNIAIAGVNSISPYSALKNVFASKGKVSDAQYEALYEGLLHAMDEVDNIFIAIHHHFNKILTEDELWLRSIWSRIEKQTMKLKKKKRLMQMFRVFSVKAVLHGHHHVMEMYKRQEVQYINSGASARNAEKDTMYYHLIDITNNLITPTLLKFTWASQRNRAFKDYFPAERLKNIQDEA
jgi:3',5'-cyclic AMP phosphodiesterase CpdA